MGGVLGVTKEDLGPALKKEEEERKWKRSSDDVTTNRWLSRSWFFSDGVVKTKSMKFLSDRLVRDRCWAVYFLTWPVRKRVSRSCFLIERQNG